MVFINEHRYEIDKLKEVCIANKLNEHLFFIYLKTGYYKASLNSLCLDFQIKLKKIKKLIEQKGITQYQKHFKILDINFMKNLHVF